MENKTPPKKVWPSRGLYPGSAGPLVYYIYYIYNIYIIYILTSGPGAGPGADQDVSPPPPVRNSPVLARLPSKSMITRKYGKVI